MSEAASLPERSGVVAQYLEASGVEAEIHVLPDSARTAAQAAAAIGCAVAAIANSLVFVADGEPILVMTSGGHRADLAVLAVSALILALLRVASAILHRKELVSS